MEEENKISFWKKIKISIFGLEDYQKLAVQKPIKAVSYLVKLMLIFVFFISIALTFKFGVTVQNVSKYIENDLSEINFENNILTVTSKQHSEEPIVIENAELLNGKLIIDTNNLTEKQINKYAEDVKGYTNGVVILKDKIIFKTAMTAVSSNIFYKDIADQYNIVKLDKQDIVNTLSGSNVWILYITFFIIMYIYLLIIYLSTVLIDTLLYSLIGYIAGMFSGLRLKYSATYNIAAHALTLPIILNLVYMLVNLFTGYTIKYFDIMYIAITCIYIITAILMIKSDIIKKQMELSKIISEQEKVRAEMEKREQERKEEEEKERVRKKDEKKRQEEKDEKDNQKEDNLEGKSKENKKKEKKLRDGNAPQPEANILMRSDR